MIVLVSLIVLLRELLVSTILHMVHPYIAIASCPGFSSTHNNCVRLLTYLRKAEGKPGRF